MKRSALGCSLVGLMYLLTACSTVPFRPDDLAQQDKRSLGRIAIVGARFQPEYGFGALTTGKGDAAAKGALGGAFRGVGSCAKAIGGGGGGAFVFSMLFLAVCAPVAAVAGAVIGGTSGAADAASAEQIEAADAAAQRAIDALKLQETMIEATLRYSKSGGLDLGHLPESMGPAKPADQLSYAEAQDTADTVIEVSVLRAVAGTTGKESLRIGLAMQARVRVLSTKTGKEVDTFMIVVGSRLRTLEEWLAEDGQAVREAFDRGAESIAEQALDEILLIYHPKKMPEQPTVGDNEQKEVVPPYALRAIKPPIRAILRSSELEFGMIERYPVDSLQPEFRWEPWPRGFDVIPGSGPGQARDIRYDLRIFGAEGWAYERLGLDKPTHRLEQPLLPCQKYRWSVRARFMLDDSPRATEWTGAYDAIGLSVAPWWFRRGSGAPALAELPGSVVFYYPIIETPGAKCRNVIATEAKSNDQTSSRTAPSTTESPKAIAASTPVKPVPASPGFSGTLVITDGLTKNTKTVSVTVVDTNAVKTVYSTGDIIDKDGDILQLRVGDYVATVVSGALWNVRPRAGKGIANVKLDANGDGEVRWTVIDAGEGRFSVEADTYLRPASGCPYRGRWRLDYAGSQPLPESYSAQHRVSQPTCNTSTNERFSGKLTMR